MIDWDRVAELRQEVGEEEFPTVVELFVDEVEQVTSGLAAISEPARLEEALHFLKGSALNIGFRCFARLCSEGESLAAAGRADKVDVASILMCYAQSKAQFLGHSGAGLAG